MKRYKNTFWNGMLEDPKGIWVKDKEVQELLDINTASFINICNLLTTEETISFILRWLLSLSIVGNIGQLIYHLN